MARPLLFAACAPYHPLPVLYRSAFTAAAIAVTSYDIANQFSTAHDCVRICFTACCFHEHATYAQLSATVVNSYFTRVLCTRAEQALQIQRRTRDPPLKRRSERLHTRGGEDEEGQRTAGEPSNSAASNPAPVQHSTARRAVTGCRPCLTALRRATTTALTSPTAHQRCISNTHAVVIIVIMHKDTHTQHTELGYARYARQHGRTMTEAASNPARAAPLQGSGAAAVAHCSLKHSKAPKHTQSPSGQTQSAP